MTCIAGINTGSKIIIAGDRMGNNSFTYGQYHEKVFKKDDFIYKFVFNDKKKSFLY